MTRLDVVTALQTLLEETYDRVYLYPEDYSSMARAPALPFLIIEELPGIEDESVDEACWHDNWNIALYAFTSRGEHVAPSAADAAAKTLAKAARNTIAAVLRSNLWLTENAHIGIDENRFMHMVTPMHWSNLEPYYGAYFELPIKEDL